MEENHDHVQHKSTVRQHDNLAFENDERVPFVNFNYAALDEEKPHADKICEAAELLSAIFRWVWCADNKTRKASKAFPRFVAMSALLNPQLLENKSYKSIGAEIGQTRANMSRIAIEFETEFGLKFRRSHNRKN